MALANAHLPCPVKRGGNPGYARDEQTAWAELASSLGGFRLGSRRTADPSAALRFGRDDKGRGSALIWGRLLTEGHPDFLLRGLLQQPCVRLCVRKAA